MAATAETVVAIVAMEAAVAMEAEVDMVAVEVVAMEAEIVVAIVAMEVAVAATEVAATRTVWKKSIAALNPQNLLSIVRYKGFLIFFKPR